MAADASSASAANIILPTGHQYSKADECRWRSGASQSFSRAALHFSHHTHSREYKRTEVSKTGLENLIGCYQPPPLMIEHVHCYPYILGGGFVADGWLKGSAFIFANI